jgi:hypothetical protein
MSTANQSEQVVLATAAAIVGVLLSGVVIYAVRTLHGPATPPPPCSRHPPRWQRSSLSLRRALELTGRAGQLVLRGAVPDAQTKERILKPARLLWGTVTSWINWRCVLMPHRYGGRPARSMCSPA